MPVGRVEFMFLYPLTFSEFLIALGDEKLCDYLSHVELADSIPEAIHQKALEKLKLYFISGGMPAVGSSYVNSRDLQGCQELQAFVLNTYRNDFGKYASVALQQHCRRVFEKTPNLVAKRFKYVDVDPDVQSRELKKAVSALRLSGIIFPGYLSKATDFPLNASVNKKDFKLLFLDVELVKYARRIDLNAVLNEDLLQLNNGAVVEQFVGQELIALQPRFDHPELYYWYKEQSKAQQKLII